MMRFLIAIVIVVVVARVIDNIRFYHQINEFIDTAEELSLIYELVGKSLRNEETNVEFLGNRFYLHLDNGDYKSLIDQVELTAMEVLDKYDLIDERYFMDMEESLLSEIEAMRKDIEDIQAEIRIMRWKNGWK